MAEISFYFDEMMPRPAAQQLTRRGYNVVMAVDMGMMGQADAHHLAFARERQMVVVTFDRPFAGKTAQHVEHTGLICLSGRQDNIGHIVQILAAFADTQTPQDVTGRVFWF